MRSTCSKPAPAGASARARVVVLALLALGVIVPAPTGAGALAECAAQERDAQERGGRDGRRDGEDRHREDQRGADGRRGQDGRRDGRRDGRGDGAPYEFGWGRRGEDGDLRTPSPREWGEVRAFMYGHSPRRLQAVDQLPDGQWKDKLRKVLFARYRGLRGLERRDPEAFRQRAEQLRVEDQIFGLVSDWASADEDARAKMRESLKGHVSRLVELDVLERKRRVERLEAELREQRAELEKDEKQHDALVEDRYNRFLDWANRWAEKRQKEKAKEEEEPRRDVEKDDD